MKKTITYLFYLILVLFNLTYKAQCQSSSQGPLSPNMVEEENGACLSCSGSLWLNQPNAMLPDSLYAATQMNNYPLCFMSGCYYARALMTESYDFTIPSNAVITGIKAEVLRKASAPNTVYDTIVRLMKAGVDTGDNKAIITPYPTGALYVTYGDSTDLWGTSWTPAEVNAPGFGVFFKPLNRNPNFVTASVDHMQVTVYYNTPVSTEQENEPGVILFFNNSTHSLIIKNAVSPAELSIYNTEGQVVYETKFSDALINKTINLVALKKGMYLAKFSAENFKTNLKFVKVD